MEISKSKILNVLDQYCHRLQDREIMRIYLTDRPNSLEQIADQCHVSVSTVKRAINRNSFIYKYLPCDELNMD
jgi:predicted DNA-binding protein YlxM (UPF0122 family)